MFSADPYVLEFIKGNFISLTMALTLLKGLAVLTKSVDDDKIVTLLQKVLSLRVLSLGKSKSKGIEEDLYGNEKKL